MKNVTCAKSDCKDCSGQEGSWWREKKKRRRGGAGVADKREVGITGAMGGRGGGCAPLQAAAWIRETKSRLDQGLQAPGHTPLALI